MIIQFVERIGSLSYGVSIASRFFHDQKITGTTTGGGKGRIVQTISYPVIVIYPIRADISSGDQGWQEPQIDVRNGIIADTYTHINHDGSRERGGLIKPVQRPRYIIELMRDVFDHKLITRRASFDEVIEPVAKQPVNTMVWYIFNPLTTVELAYLGVIGADKTAFQNNDQGIELPRFTASPEFGYEQLGEDMRGSAGQPYGRTIRQLRTISVKFARVKMDIIDFLYRKVGTTKPHWVVPYPEAISKYPPIWATLTEPPKFTGRAENGWYYNVSLSWKEAY